MCPSTPLPAFGPATARRRLEGMNKEGTRQHTSSGEHVVYDLSQVLLQDCRQIRVRCEGVSLVLCVNRESHCSVLESFCPRATIDLRTSVNEPRPKSREQSEETVPSRPR
jgi:hypothetical protein